MESAVSLANICRQIAIMPLPPVLLFDAYGTLFDVHSVTARLEARFPGKGAALSQSWRVKQLEMTWQRTLMQRYVDFNQVTEEALRYACAVHACEYSQAFLAELMTAYRALDLFPESRGTLESLKTRRVRMGILSNGAPDMLSAVVAHNGLSAFFEAVLSADALKQFKPSPRVYQMAEARFAVPKSDIGFVSANGWDASGAKSFGFRVYWVNRQQLPHETTGFPPDATLADLSGLLG
jgi:2-haloacid dehalogenase